MKLNTNKYYILLLLAFGFSQTLKSYYNHFNDDNTCSIKSIWLNYDAVKEILLKEQVNFNLYEALFTKNVFNIFEINNYFWEKEDY